MIDPINLEDLQNHIKQYKTGGNIMPTDVAEDLKDFKESLKNATSDVDKQFFIKSIEKIKTSYPNSEDIDFINETDNSIDDLHSGNYYKNNPSKLLGEIAIVKDRHGKMVQILKGDISVLKAIDVNTDFDQFKKATDVAVSETSKTIDERLIIDGNNGFITDVIKKSIKDVGRKSVKKTKAKEVETTDTEAKVQSYKDIFEKYNKSITKEELRAYLYYKNEIGHPLSETWYELADYNSDDRSKAEKVKEWMQTGVLFYFSGEYLPLPLYASGNIYEKISRIVKTGDNSGADINYIIKNYGKETLEHHLRVLNESFSSVYKNRLILTGNADENSLILKPVSKFCKSFQITETNSSPQFKWWVKADKVDYNKHDGKDYQKKEIASMSLTESFCLWLVTGKDKISIKGGITFNDIIYFYIERRTKQAPSNLDAEQEARWKANLLRTKSLSSSEGNRLFLEFLKEELNLNQKVQIETQWNSQYNNYLKPDFNKIPVAFNLAESFFGEEPFEVKPEKREAVSYIFNEGSGCLAYDVGVGKSISALMIMEQFIVAGYCKRPFLVVPNQTYKQWLSEIKNALPHRKTNGFFNLGVDIDIVRDDNNNVIKVDEGSITVLTYEGFAKLGFNSNTESALINELYEILNQGGAEEQMSEKQKAGFYEKLEKLIGKGLKGTNIEIESLGFDFVCFDEAHALKKVFTSVKGEQVEGEKKAKKNYQIQSGTPSDTALKGFMISQYILRNNKFRNVLLLTATPFTNSPLEVFSMLSLVAYQQLDKLGLKNINDFFDNYIDVSNELVINHKLQPQYKEIVKGFNNLPSLQKIVFRFFNYKDGDDVGVVRPNKIVIPYTKKLVNGEIVKLGKDEEITSYIELSPLQKKYMEEVIAYAEGKIELSGKKAVVEDVDEDEDSNGDSVDESSLDAKAKAGVRALRSMNFCRNIALSPYLYEYKDVSNPTYKEYINTSPKLKYVMECIKSIKTYHIKNNEPMSGQVIYMDRGLKYFNLIQDYLVYELGFEKHEVGQITAKMDVNKKRLTQDAFLGRKYNETLQDYEPITDAERIKVLLGSSSIKEGINLQKKSTCLYNCFLDWNPTDVIQLQGRIWRQQNEFMNVRIVNPLMIDSIDIFMFQKLEEKTARINTIWSSDGRSVLKIEDIDTEEIKMALIKDPIVLAKLKSEIFTVKLADDKNALNVINKRLEDYMMNVYSINQKVNQIKNIIETYIPAKKDDNIISQINALISFYKNDYPKDVNGKIMLSNFDRKYNYADVLKDLKVKDSDISAYEKPSADWWWKSIVEAKRLVEKENKDLLAVRNINPDEVRDAIEKNKAKTIDIDNELAYLKSEDYLKKEAEKIIAEREKNKFEIKSIEENVNNFSRLNYLLSLKRVKIPTIAKTIESKVIDLSTIKEKLLHLTKFL